MKIKCKFSKILSKTSVFQQKSSIAENWHGICRLNHEIE